MILKKAIVTGLINISLAPAALAMNASECAERMAQFYKLKPNEEKVLEGLNDDGKACTVKLRYFDGEGSLFLASMDSEADEYGSVYVDASVSPTNDFERTRLISCKANDERVSFRSRAKQRHGWHKKFRYSFSGTHKRIEMKERVTGLWTTNHTNKAHCNFR